MPTRPNPEPRGSTLLLVVILLSVLTIVGVTAVRLSSQERVNAHAKDTRDRLVACANAARLQLWAELTRSGPEYLKSADPAVEIRLPDGTVLSAPGHFTSAGKDALPVVDLIDTVPLITAAKSVERDITNSMASPRSTKGTLGNVILAKCRDEKGRELLVEVVTKFAIF